MSTTFIETRGNDGRHPGRVPFSDAILTPMASFGGLYSPERLPELDTAFFEQHRQSGYAELARDLINRFGVDIDGRVIDEALSLYRRFDDPDSPCPVVKVKEGLFVSELWHGPTRAFKDMALQPFGVVLSALAKARDEKYLILAATSGDTGPAALETFKNRDGVRVACLYPDGGTSDVQRLQMVTEDAPNLKVIGIHGNFDDAQAALKQLLASANFQRKLDEKGIELSAANSVNFGRILFQIIYHVHSYLELLRQGAIETGEKIYLDVPSGNFGNALGGYYAWKMGLPVERIIIASNRNNVLTDLIRHGRYDLRQRELIATTSPAMDILVSSNVERVLFDLFGPERTRQLMTELAENRCYQLDESETATLQRHFVADFCDDAEGQRYIRDSFEQHGYLMDPHTATCFKAFDSCREKPLATIAYSTAEWTKFSPVIAEALTGQSDLRDREALQLIARKAGIDIPPMIDALFDKPIAQPTVIDKQHIEREILDFLEG